MLLFEGAQAEHWPGLWDLKEKAPSSKSDKALSVLAAAFRLYTVLFLSF